MELRDISIGDLLTDVELYKSITINNNVDDFNKLIKLLYLDFEIDYYCEECKEERLFNTYKIDSYTSNMIEDLINKSSMFNFGKKLDIINNILSKQKYFSREFVCSYNKEHLHVFHFIYEDYVLKKIGQNQIFNNIFLTDINKYKSILSKEDYRNLNRGIALYVQGLGAGALVYMRRVFENLIDKSYQICLIKENNKKLVNNNISIQEKIERLKGYLPQYLLENEDIHKALSVEVHALSEVECLKYYDVLRDGMQVIMDEELIKIEEIEINSKINKEINKIIYDYNNMDNLFEKCRCNLL